VNSDEHHTFTNTTVPYNGHCWLYMKTDGFTDQLGGEKRLRYGTARFEKLILENHKEPFAIQRKDILKSLFDHRGSNEQMDDITVIGFRV
jgi:serine phosphatase RsbU (regulator of sigma subunit)